MPLCDILERYSQTVGERLVIDDILAVALLSQRLFGQQILDPRWTWRRFAHYQIINACIYVYVFFGTLSVIRNPDSQVELIMEALYTMVVLFISPLKLILFFLNRKAFRKAYVMMKTAIFDMICEESEDKINIIFKTMSKMVFVLFSVLLIPFVAYELSMAWHYLCSSRKWMSSSTDTLMPITSPYFEVCWVIHSIFFMAVCMTVAPIDMWFVILVYFFCLASDSLIKVLKVDARGVNEDEQSYAQRLDTRLKKFYTNHVKLLEYYSTLVQMYRWLVLVPLLNVALSMCVVLQVITEVPPRSHITPYLIAANLLNVSARRRLYLATLLFVVGQNLQFVTNTLPLFAEVFAYSWFGERLKNKMNDVQTAVVKFEWTSLARRDISKYKIVASYTSRDLGVTTALGHDLSLITMTTVLKSSYQAFTVLQTTS